MLGHFHTFYQYSPFEDVPFLGTKQKRKKEKEKVNSDGKIDDDKQGLNS